MTPIARIGRAARMHRLGWVLALIVSQLAALRRATLIFDRRLPARQPPASRAAGRR